MFKFQHMNNGHHQILHCWLFLQYTHCAVLVDNHNVETIRNQFSIFIIYAHGAKYTNQYLNSIYQ